MAEIEKLLGCKERLTLKTNRNDYEMQDALKVGTLQGWCPFVEKDVEFNVGSLMGYPLTAVCTNLHCRFHTRPEEIK